ncbi:MAG: D-alanyl-D-alanine carboxypeptidase, partial [Candidatus Moranbacteria bacterium]|nr:D-alanyl-D-alanine carboxypeptidase [Candidatus Moranbacteria bacterium]
MISRSRILILGLFILVSIGFFNRAFLIEKFNKDETETISVKGARFDFDEAYNDNIAFEKLIVRNPDAPIKREEFGKFYAQAQAAVTIDAETNTILHYQNAKKRRPIASLTKIMTAVLVVENIKDLKNEIVVVDEEAVYEDGTKIGCPRGGYCVSTRLQVGERISAWNLFQAMVMNSTNDAAVALARYIAGSEEKFAEMMNEKAREIGLEDTNFCNPSGLDDEDNPGRCYSTAYDMARIAAYSLKYNEIWDTMKIRQKEIYSSDGKIKHQISNTDKLLDTMPNCIGGKTGFTYEAGQC